jgi:transposase
MLGFNAQQTFYIYRGGVDMRKGVHSLCGLVRNELQGDPNDGSVYVFFSKTHQTVKLLVWDKDGYVVYGKWLSKGKYESLHTVIDDKKQSISYHHLVMLLSGVSLLGAKQRPRYNLGG